MDLGEKLKEVMIVGHGIDLVDIASLQPLVEDPAGHFIERCFTPLELAAAGDGPNRLERLACRFAAKEAVLKALGTGFGAGLGFLDVEILTLPSGVPSVLLHGQVDEKARALGITGWLVSTSHSGAIAIASAIAE